MTSDRIEVLSQHQSGLNRDDSESSPISLGQFGQDHRLLFVVNDGGFFLSHRLAIAVAAQKAGFDVLIACPTSTHTPQIAALGFRHIPFEIDRWNRGVGAQLKAIQVLVGIYKEIKPNIVHHVTIKPVILGSIAAQIAAVPSVVNAVSGLGFIFVTEGVVARFRRTIVQFLYRLALRHPNQRTIFQNPDDLSLFIEKGLAKRSATVLIRGSGVDTDFFSRTPEPPLPIRVVLPARLLRDKGIAEFVAAAEILRSQKIATSENVRFIVAGELPDGNPAAILPSELQRWRNEGIVEFIGFESDMRRLLEQSHIICLPSYREGLPLALLEAASVGRAIVTCDVPGCREIVQDGFNGLLVPARDATKLAQALGALIGNPTLRQRMAENGRQLVTGEGFDRTTVVNQHLALYRQLLIGNGNNMYERL